MKYIQEKPAIMIGYEKKYHTNHSVDEVAYGIEEEGCLFEKYVLSDSEDIRLGTAGVAVILNGGRGGVHVFDLKDGACLYSVWLSRPEEFRRVGQNAARYLKNMKLDLP